MPALLNKVVISTWDSAYEKVLVPQKDTSAAMQILINRLRNPSDLLKLHLKTLSHVSSSISTPDIKLASA
jgi:hypothetical protein